MYAPLDDTLLNQPPAVQAAFLDLLASTILVDGVVDHREVQVLVRIAQDLGDERPPEALLETAADPDILARLLAPVARYALLQAALVAAADGVCHDHERAWLSRLAVAMDTDPAFVDRALSWALRGVQWLEEGRGLLGE